MPLRAVLAILVAIFAIALAAPPTWVPWGVAIRGAMPGWWALPLIFAALACLAGSLLPPPARPPEHRFATLTLGLGLLLLGIFQFRKVRASHSWPSTAGRILSAKVDVSESRGNEDTPDSTSYIPAVRYEYTAGTQTLQGDRIAFVARAYNDRPSAAKALEPYPVGAPVTVYFNPKKPSDAVLHRAAMGGRLLIAIGGAVLLLGVAALLKR